MAIGVSYTGHDGRRVDFSTEGNPAPGSALDNIVRGAGGRAGALTPLADAMRRARRPSVPDPRLDKAAGTVRLDQADQKPGTLSEKLMAGGSIEASFSGLRLKGEDGTGMGGVYARSGTRQGFLSLDEIDNPSEKGGVVGEPDAMNRLAPTNQQASPNGPFSVNVQSRTEAEVNELTGEVTFWEYTKRFDVTDGRRVGDVSGETKRKICSFFLGDGDRQITYTMYRYPFTVVRSHYKDEEGNTQYEFWAKCPKWGSIRKKSDTSTNNSLYVGYILGALFCGVYRAGEYGHYPVRPEGRPRHLVFDSGREALADLFEELDDSEHEFDYCNKWTYIGGSEDGKILGVECEDGNIELFGSAFRYSAPFKSEFHEEVTDEEGLVIRWEESYSSFSGYYWKAWPGVYRHDDPYWSYEWMPQCQMVLTASRMDERGLVDFLFDNNAIAKDALSNEGYDKECVHTTYTYNGEKIIDAFRTPAMWEDSPGFFPSEEALRKSGETITSYRTNPYEFFEYAYGESFSGRNFFDIRYPEGADKWASEGFQERTRSRVIEIGDSFCKTDYLNKKTGAVGPYSGKPSDYFSFDYMNTVCESVCKIEDWEIVENHTFGHAYNVTSNRFVIVTENARGDVIDMLVRSFGDKVEIKGEGEVIIVNDVVVVKRNRK